jgi:pSer/pThr/pTyr-binding forkhead associated (FHA) protein
MERSRDQGFSRGTLPVKDPVISRFAEACGATGPLDLRVDLAEGGVLAEGNVPMPYSLIGRDDACHVTLNDAEVNPRHTWLQVIGGRVYAVDLGSRTGLSWPDGATGSGWLDVGVSARIGPFQLRLRSPVAARTAAFPNGYIPLHSDSNLSRSCPTVSLEFRNGKRAKDRWTINRLLTTIGRSPECKIRLTADDIAGYHCGLVLAPGGVWVVDLSGRGVVVNGERMRVSPLRHGAELWIGRFLIGVHFSAVSNASSAARSGPTTPLKPHSILAISKGNGRTPSGASSLSRPTPEDEVELGVVPTADAASGLPSSHIMADAFRAWTSSSPVNGPVSNPILVSGSGPVAHASPIPSTGTHPPSPPKSGPLSERLSAPDSTNSVGVLLRELGELHGQMLVQFQQSLVLMVQLFGCLRKDQLPEMQRELARIQELNTELAQLQGEVARRAIEETGPPTPPRMQSPRNTPPIQPSSSEIVQPRTSDLDSTSLQHWVQERINSLQQERQTRWQLLVGMFSGKNAG